MHDISRPMTILDQQRQVRRFSQISNSARLLDRSSCKLGFHELGIGAVLGCLLLGLRVGQVGDGHSVNGHAVLAIAKRILFLGREDTLSRFELVAFVVSGGWVSHDRLVVTGWGCSVEIPICILGFGVFLAFGGWDSAFDGESYTVGARHPETGSIATNLVVLDGRGWQGQ